jgi:hypothetical protein
MSVILEKQIKFMGMIARLIPFIHSQGFQVTPGCFRCFKPGHHMENSLHYIGLAADLHLYKDGKYLSKTEDHEPFGIFWESLGGTWGGRFSDGNHYSLEYNGRR